MSELREGIALAAEISTYLTPAGDRAEARPVGPRGGVELYDIEVIRDGEIVDYMEDMPGWQVRVLATQHGWRPDAD